MLASEQWMHATAEELAEIAAYYDGERANFTGCIIVASGVP